MELNEILEFKSSSQISAKLSELGFAKSFSEGEIIQNENAYVYYNTPQIQTTDVTKLS